MNVAEAQMISKENFIDKYNKTEELRNLIDEKKEEHHQSFNKEDLA